ALARRGASRIAIVNRTARRALGLVARMRARFPHTEWSYVPPERAASGKYRTSGGIGGFDLVLNCVPKDSSLPLGDILEAARCDGSVFCDLNYSSGPTTLSRSAANAQYRVVPGLEVLLWQGAYALELFTGLPAPVGTMRGALAEVAGEWSAC
ncbi:MAG: hypothetical protein NUV93_09570, partial [Firmicutes bacterium]|nr:hypothetical protein [Bacillota bacterium]